MQWLALSTVYYYNNLRSVTVVWHTVGLESRSKLILLFFHSGTYLADRSEINEYISYLNLRYDQFIQLWDAN